MHLKPEMSLPQIGTPLMPRFKPARRFAGRPCVSSNVASGSPLHTPGDVLLRAGVAGANVEEEVVGLLLHEQIVRGLRGEHRELVVHGLAVAAVAELPRPAHVLAEVVHPAVVAERQRAPEQVLEPRDALGLREIDGGERLRLARDEERLAERAVGL